VFCSNRCRERFQTEPDRYARTGRGNDARAGKRSPSRSDRAC
jgi:hypothetical protein